MAEKPEELNLPTSSVIRIVKESLPAGIKLSKDAQTAICKAASVFVLYCTACSNTYAQKAKRKTLTASDVFSALQDMEFEQFVPELKDCLEAHKEEQKSKVADRKRKQQVAAEEVSEAKRSSDDASQEGHGATASETQGTTTHGADSGGTTAQGAESEMEVDIATEPDSAS